MSVVPLDSMSARQASSGILGDDPGFKIGEIAVRAAVSVQTLRYYERLGLLAPSARRASGYRVYGAHAIRRVRFIKRAQELGFSLNDIADLLALWERSGSACEEVEAHASATLRRIEEKVHDLERMRTALHQYVSACHTHSTMDECPLLRALDQPGESEA